MLLIKLSNLINRKEILIKVHIQYQQLMEHKHQISFYNQQLNLILNKNEILDRYIIPTYHDYKYIDNHENILNLILILIRMRMTS